MGFVEAIMTVDLRHNVVAGFEGGFPDLLARPDLPTMVPLPWEEDVVACLVDLEDPVTHEPHPLDCRGVLKRVLGAVLGVRRLAGGRARARVLPAGAGCKLATRVSSLRRPGQRGLHRRRHGRSAGHARADARRRGRARARGDRRRPRIRSQPVRDQPPPLRGARLMRPRVPVPGDGQGARGPRRADRDVHGQAVQRRRGLGVPSARVARRRRRRQCRRGCRRRPRPHPRHVPLHRGRDGARAGDDGVLQPDRERLPADQRRGARPDARVLGPRPPDDARAGPQGARVLDAARAPPRRRDREPVPRLRRRARGRARRDPPRARAPRARRGDDLRPARRGARRLAPDLIRRGARGAQGGSGDDRRARPAAGRDVRDDQGGRARAVPRVGHRLGVRGVLEASVSASSNRSDPAVGSRKAPTAGG